MIVKLLTEHHLEIISLKEGCRVSSESTLVKSHAAAQIFIRLTISPMKGSSLHCFPNQ